MTGLRRALPLSLVALSIGAIWGCFGGEGALGAYCNNDAQCGPRQRCSDSICGLCNNDTIDAGELCFANSSEETVMGQVADLLPLQPISEGATVGERVGAIVNGRCPGDQASDCWALYLFEYLDGDFETTTPAGTANPGRIPQAAHGSFDGEGRDDLAFVIVRDDLPDMSTVAVLFDFPNVVTSADIDVSLVAASLRAADLNGDGLDDILLGGDTTAALSIVLADPNGGFGNERLIVTDPIPRLAPPGDFDGDGSLDLAIASIENNTVGVDLNDGFGNFAPQGRETIDSHLSPEALEIGDLDHDGNLDLVVFAPPRVISTMPLTRDPQGVPAIYVYYGRGDGSFDAPEILDGGEEPVSGLVADINYDGWLDIVIADAGEDKLPVFINREGSFPESVTIDVAAGPRTLLLADFTRDGIDDIIVGNANGVVAVVPAEN